MQLAQGGKCAICGNPPPEGKKLNIDHNHYTMVVRELLCGTCNTGLGMFKDSFELLEKAAVYLKKHYDPDRDPKALWEKLKALGPI